MNSLNVIPDIGNSNNRIESAEANSKKIAQNNEVVKQQTQKITDESVVNVVMKPTELEKVVVEINQVMATVQRDINFSIDDKSGRKIISVYEKGTDTLIRQLPSEDALKLLHNLEELKGILFETEI